MASNFLHKKHCSSMLEEMCVNILLLDTTIEDP